MDTRDMDTLSHLPLNPRPTGSRSFVTMVMESATHLQRGWRERR